MTDGLGGTSVCAGIIGEIGTSGDVHEQEERVLRAGARASLETGVPVSVHPPSDRDILDRGAYVEFDLFGRERYLAEAEDAKPSDVDRAEYVAELVEEGYTDRLFLSQDIFLKHLRRTYGGHGYAHILTNVLPMFGGAGVPDDAVEQMLTTNPQRMLIGSFVTIFSTTQQTTCFTGLHTGIAQAWR